MAQRDWTVVQRYCNHSTFNGRHYTPSEYSSVICHACNTSWRTKAAYVASLKDVDFDRWLKGKRT